MNELLNRLLKTSLSAAGPGRHVAMKGVPTSCPMELSHFGRTSTFPIPFPCTTNSTLHHSQDVPCQFIMLSDGGKLGCFRKSPHHDHRPISERFLERCRNAKYF